MAFIPGLPHTCVSLSGPRVGSLLPVLRLMDRRCKISDIWSGKGSIVSHAVCDLFLYWSEYESFVFRSFVVMKGPINYSTSMWGCPSQKARQHQTSLLPRQVHAPPPPPSRPLLWQSMTLLWVCAPTFGPPLHGVHSGSCYLTVYDWYHCS